MEDTLKKIQKYKREIAVAKQQKAEAEGAVKTNKARLVSEFGVNTLNKARDKREEFLKKRDAIKIKITDTMNSLEETYGL